MVKPRGRVTHRRARTLTGARPRQIVRLGVAHVPEGRGTFAALTVDENLRLGAYRAATAT